MKLYRRAGSNGFRASAWPLLRPPENVTSLPTCFLLTDPLANHDVKAEVSTMLATGHPGTLARGAWESFFSDRQFLRFPYLRDVFP